MGSYEIRETKEILENAKPQPAPHALTREQVEHLCDDIRDMGHMSVRSQMLFDHDAAQRQALERQAQRIQELKTICLETYQVVGSLAGDAGMFEHEATQKALDNLGRLKLVHATVLPYPCAPSSANQQAQEMERLTKGNDSFRTTLDVQATQLNGYVQEVERLKAEKGNTVRANLVLIERLAASKQEAVRLRETLEEIIRQCPYGATPAERNIAKLAQRALKGA